MLFSILGYFLRFHLPNSLKNQNLEKVKKTLKISSFYYSVPKIMIIYDHMLHCSCRYGTYWIRLLFFILSHFLNFYPHSPRPPPPNSPKNQNLKQWKTYLQISSFYRCVPKIMIRWCTVPEVSCVTNVITFLLRPFFALSPR